MKYLNPHSIEFLLREGPVVVFTLTPGPPWSLTSISSSVERFFGVTPEVALANPNFFWDHLHPEDIKIGQERASELLVTGRVTHTCRMRHIDGTYLWVKGEFHLARDSSGKVLDVVGFLSDDTEVNRSKAILAAIPDAVIEVSAEGIFTFFHAHPLNNYRPADQVIGKSVREILPGPAADIFLNAVRRTLNSESTQCVKYAVPSDNGVRHFQAVLGAANEGRTVVGLVQDISADVLGEKTLSEQARFLEEANTYLEQFVYIVSHDLREPLIGVAGFASLLKKRYGHLLDERGVHFVDGILQGSKNMEAKIDDLLELSRVGRGNTSGEFPLGVAIEGAKRSLVEMLRDPTVELVVPDTLPIVRGDRGQLVQVFQNLISNSIKYRQGPVRVEVSASEDPSYPGKVLVSVKDNGVGFDMKHANRIFDVFQRLYSSQQYPGTGIGLAIVKKVIERHSGKIWAVSQPGGGSTFFFTLPRAA